MQILLFWGVALLIAGIACIASTFVVQKAEDKHRVEGYYTTANVKKIVMNQKDKTAEVTFEFTMDYQVKTITQKFSHIEENLKVGRNVLIVYDQVNNVIYHNPMKRSRKIQAILITIGFVLILAGIQFTVMGASA